MNDPTAQIYNLANEAFSGLESEMLAKSKDFAKDKEEELEELKIKIGEIVKANEKRMS